MNKWKKTKRHPSHVIQTELILAGQVGLGLGGVQVHSITIGPRQPNQLGPNPTSGWAELDGLYPVCDMTDSGTARGKAFS